jgi:moderate conductance mechanosensitive channel
VDDELAEVCGPDPSWSCESIWNATNSRFLAGLVDGVIRPLIVAAIIIVVAALLNRWLRRLVTKVITEFTRTDRAAGAALGKLGVGVGPERDEIRARTLSAVARTTVSAMIWTVAVLIVLGLFSISLGPLLASAGIAGLAVGLGAQQLVKDCIAGFFILLEDQCGVGDVIDAGPAIGTVESITLRATTLRDADGTMWTVPNGAIVRVGNRSREWAERTVDVTVARATQLDDAVEVIQRVTGEVSTMPDVAPALLQPIAVLGVESMGATDAVVRVTVRTKPGGDGPVLRTLRAALVRELGAAGIGADPG